MMVTVKDTPGILAKIPTWEPTTVDLTVNSDQFKGKTIQQAVDMRKALSPLIDRQYLLILIARTDQEIANTFIPAPECLMVTVVNSE